MDKRSFIAVLLTFAVLLLWQFLYIAPKQKEVVARRTAALREKAARDSLEALDKEQGTETAAQEGAGEGEIRGETSRNYAETEGFAEAGGEKPERLISIDNGKIRVTLSSRGGELTQVQLKDFSRKNGGPVELIPEGRRGALALALERNGIWEKLSGVDFETSIDGRPAGEREDLVLGEERQRAEVVFAWSGKDGELIERRFHFERDSYEVTVSVRIDREGGLRRSSAYSISWDSGMALNEKDVKGEMRQAAALGMVGQEFFKESAGKLKKTEKKTQEGMVVWAGARTKYFVSALIAEKQRTSVLELLGDSGTGTAGYGIEYPFGGDPRFVDDSFKCYLGPLDMYALKGYGVGLEKAIDLGRLRFFSVFILRLMVWMKRFIPNYGVIIIILSVLTKILFYRLSHKSFKSMKDMQRLQPKLKEIQEKYKDNKDRLNKETMKMYKEAGVNPLGGCLPLLFQMPVFIALFNVLRNTIELRSAPFVLWMNDLSSPDVLFDFRAKLPLIGSEFHLLPILMGLAMYLQSKLGGSPTGETATTAQTKMMSSMMPIVLTFVFYNMPSGLVLYWFVNNILSIVQQYYVHKAADAETAGAEAAKA